MMSTPLIEIPKIHPGYIWKATSITIIKILGFTKNPGINDILNLNLLPAGINGIWGVIKNCQYLHYFYCKKRG